MASLGGCDVFFGPGGRLTSRVKSSRILLMGGLEGNEIRQKRLTSSTYGIDISHLELENPRLFGSARPLQAPATKVSLAPRLAGITPVVFVGQKSEISRPNWLASSRRSSLIWLALRTQMKVVDSPLATFFAQDELEPC